MTALRLLVAPLSAGSRVGVELVQLPGLRSRSRRAGAQAHVVQVATRRRHVRRVEGRAPSQQEKEREPHWQYPNESQVLFEPQM